jgi:DNA-binding transcriptional LysR family regulator
MAEDLDALETLRVVAELGSFTRAAAKLRVGGVSVSHRVTQLEERLGVKLLARTTRSLKLTAAGELYLQRYARVDAELRAARAAVMGRGPAQAPASPAEHLRLRAPSSLFYRYLAERLPAFLIKNPQISVSLSLHEAEGDRPDLLVGAARGSPAAEALLLAPSPQVVVASPAYLARAGALTDPRELAKHSCLLRTGEEIWRLRGPRGFLEVPVLGRLIVERGEGLLPALFSGLGLALLPLYAIERELSLGALALALPSYRDEEGAIYALPVASPLAPPAERFLDFLRRELSGSR